MTATQPKLEETVRTLSRSQRFLERRFRLEESETTVRTDVLAGFTTFLTMAYIVFVNPAILGAAGMPQGAVTVVTALGAGFATLGMGAFTNLPFAMASGLGINAIVAFDLILGRKLAWPVAMSCIVLEGLVACVLVLAGLREAIMRAVPREVKLAIGAGIGLFIALVGLRDAGISINNSATGIGLGDMTSGPVLVSLAGLLVAIVLNARSQRSARFAILAGILTSTVVGLIFGVLDGPSKVAELPGSGSFSTVGDALAPGNLGDALTWALVPVIFVLFMGDFFDTVGTGVAVAEAGGPDLERRLSLKTRAFLLWDSFMAFLGGVLGISSMTTYVESGAGVASGARTGLSNVVTAVCFVLTIFFVPLIAVVAQGVTVGQTTFYPAIAPALIMVGALMFKVMVTASLNWNQAETYAPAFLTAGGIVLTFSISAGIGFGVISYVAIMVSKGKGREVHGLMYALVPLFCAFYASGWLEKHVF